MLEEHFSKHTPPDMQRKGQRVNDPAVRTALKQAWQESNPGVSGGHEEGGFLWQQH